MVISHLNAPRPRGCLDCGLVMLSVTRRFLSLVREVGVWHLDVKVTWPWALTGWFGTPSAH